MLTLLHKTIDTLIAISKQEITFTKDLKIKEARMYADQKEAALKEFMMHLEQLKALANQGYKLPEKDKKYLQERLNILNSLILENDRHLVRFAQAQERFLKQLKMYSSDSAKSVTGYKASGHINENHKNLSVNALTFQANL